MKELFGTDGIRGKAGEFPLDSETIEIIGKSIAKQFREIHGRNPRFLTGMDTRESGAWIERAITRGARSEGAELRSAGVITTPGVAFLTGEEGFDAGVVISASHNPFQDNGIKVFLPSGKKIDSAIERTVERAIYAAEFVAEASDEVDHSKSKKFVEDYLAHLREKHSSLDISGLKIVVDCANGASSELAPQLFEGFGANVVAIHNTPDGKNINLNCGSLHLEQIQKSVIDESANFGVAFDGDADRSLFVDENGKIVDGDATLWVLAKHLKAHNKLKDNHVIATVMSNIGLERALDSEGISLSRTSVGDKYVLQELLTTGASLGGEQSGHIIVPSRSLVGDGMQTALLLLAAMAEQNKSLSDLVEGFVQFPQILLNVHVAKKLPFEEVPEIESAAAAVSAKLDTGGRLLLRYSGTENLARVMIEGEDQTEIEAMAHELAETIKNALA
ncbi:MAG: phosphoglucosamine mutase [Pyrinomonadaceae bacterium]